jgi:S1-C subfamily serine protease
MAKQLAFGAVVIVLAAAAGFAGGRFSEDAGSNLSLSGTLSKQQKIVSSESQLINQISKNVNPSVVSVNVTATTTSSDIFSFGQQQTERAAGTGIIISKSGVIMTNRHVVPEGTTTVSVTLADGTTYSHVKVLGRTSSGDSLDIAFLQIQNLNGKTLTPAVLGDSSQSQIGDEVVAIGNALGQFQNTVTSGIISGFGRNVEASSGGRSLTGSSDSEDLNDLIQTDAAINEGNSGGPLVNLNGQVIGINTAIASDSQNIGFAIPINDVRGLINQVLSTGTFQQPYIGIRYIPLTAAIAKQYGVDVDQGAYVVPEAVSGQPAVVSGSPAEQSGLRGGDVVTAIDGAKITANQSLTTLIDKHKPGDKVKLTVLRGGKTLQITVTLGNASSASDTNS